MTELDRLVFDKNCPFESNCELRCSLDEERGKRIFLESQIEQYKNDFQEVLRKVGETFALRHYVERASEIRGVDAVYLIRREAILDLWTVISENNLDVEEQIAKIQGELMRIYTSLDFDFMVIPANIIKIENLLPKEAMKLSGGR
jgi:hypothetical protein